MTDEVKKISFGFSKLAKKTFIVDNKISQQKSEDSKVEFIDCLEGKSIKLKDPVKALDKPLVIPLKRELINKPSGNQELTINTLESVVVKNNVDKDPTTTNELVTGIENSKENKLSEDKNLNPAPSEALTLDEIAAREILEEVKKTEPSEEIRILNVPLTSNAPSGEKESSLDDYENIPVNAFGFAMLRGMGWAPGKGIGKNEKLVTPSLPTLRPKGMGLGADKVIKAAEDRKTTNEELQMVKGSFIRVIAGPHKDSYGQIEGFDDESGRLIIKLALKSETVSLNEFMVQLVDKNEFTKNSKVINVSKYEQYKDDEVKVSSERTSRELTAEVKLRKEEDKKYSGTKEKFVSKSLTNKRQLSNTSESEHSDGIITGTVVKKSGSSRKSRDDFCKRSESSSKSPDPRKTRHSRSPTNTTSYSRNKHERKSLHREKLEGRSKSRHISSSSDASSSSRSAYSQRTKSHSRCRTTSSKHGKKQSHRERPVKQKNRHRSSSSEQTHSSSHNYSIENNKRSRSNKKKPSSRKKSRSRSRTPKKYKVHKKHKKCKYN